jgi:RNA polymerase sigma-70 factor (ECF subfamily)
MKAASAILENSVVGASEGIADFDAWMLLEQRRVYLLCIRLLRDKDEADSVTQDVFVEAYRAMTSQNIPPIREPAKWLTRVTVNTCYDRLRSRRWMFWRKRLSGADGSTYLRSTPAAGLTQEDELRAREIAKRLGKALERLSVRQRLVFALRFEEDRSLAEIGEILGLDLGTVKAHMSRAVKKLRGELRDLYVGSTLER